MAWCGWHQDKFTDAENKLKDEEGKVNSAKNKVNGLQNEINKYDGEKKHCKHWYDVSCKTHNGWLDTKIAALWVAKHAADAALDVVNDALKVAKDAVSDASKVVANIKPEYVTVHAARALAAYALPARWSLTPGHLDRASRVVKLEAENAAIEVAYKAAEAGLDAAKGLTNAALDAIDFAAEAVANILNIEEVSISAGSLAGVKCVPRGVAWHRGGGGARACVRDVALTCSCVPLVRDSSAAGRARSCLFASRASSLATTSTGPCPSSSLRSWTTSCPARGTRSRTTCTSEPSLPRLAGQQSVTEPLGLKLTAAWSLSLGRRT